MRFSMVSVLLIYVNTCSGLSGVIDEMTDSWGPNSEITSPVHIDGDILVSGGTVLSIEPGTTIIFEQNKSSEIRLIDSARMMMEGNSESHIQIEGFGESANSIQLAGKTHAKISHARLFNVNLGVGTEDTVIIKNTLFSYSQIAVHAEGYLELKNNSVCAEATALSLENTGTYDITSNIFVATKTYGVSVFCGENEIPASDFRYNALYGRNDYLSDCISDTENIPLADIPFNDHCNSFLFVESSSPTIDAGDPTSDYSLEPDCDGKNTRVNMGAYGNTPEAACKVEASVESLVLRRQGKPYETTNDLVIYDLRGRMVRSTPEEKFSQGIMITEGLHGELKIRNLIP